jgi:phage terminase small subunit
LEKPENVEYMKLLIERNAKKGYASLDRVKSFLSDVMEGRVKDQFGLDASLSDRIKAAEDIIRCEGGFKDKTEVSLNVNVAEMLKAARERATSRQIPAKSSPEIIDVTPVGES